MVPQNLSQSQALGIPAVKNFELEQSQTKLVPKAFLTKRKITHGILMGLSLDVAIL